MSGGERLEIVADSQTGGVKIAASPDPDQLESGGASEQHDRAIATGVVWQGALRWLVQILSWTATLVIARRLSPEDYGIAGTATVLVGLVSQVTDLGIGRALMMRRESNDEILGQAYSAAIIVGFIAACVILAGAIPMAHFYGEPRVAPLIALLALLPIISGASSVPLAVLQQKLRYREVALVEFSRSFFQALAVLLCAIAGLRYWSLAIGTLIGSAVVLFLSRRFVTVSVRRPFWHALRPTVSYAGHLVIGAMAWYLYSNADFVVVGRTAGLVALGYYQFAWNVAQLPGEKLGNILQSVVGPFFAAIGDDRPALRHYFLLLSEFLMSIMLPVLCGFALVSPIAVPLLFGAKWLAAVPTMQVLVMCAAVSAVSLLGQHVLTATGQADVSMRLSVITLLVLPVAFYVAGRSWGPFAVACVWLVAQPVLVGVVLRRVGRTLQLPVSEYLGRLKAPCVCSALMVLSIVLLRTVVDTPSQILRLTIFSFAGTAVYAGAFRVLYAKRIAAMVAILRTSR